MQDGISYSFEIQSEDEYKLWILMLTFEVESSFFQVVASCLGLKCTVKFDGDIWSLKSRLKLKFEVEG